MALSKNNRSQLVLFVAVAATVAVLGISCSKKADAQTLQPGFDVTVLRVVDGAPTQTIGPCVLIQTDPPEASLVDIDDDGDVSMTLALDCNRVFVDSFE